MSDYVDGASSSLNMTITAVMQHMNDEGWRPGPNHGGLRDFLYDKLSELTAKAYKKGFKRGHIECYNAFRQTDAVPRTLAYQARKRRLSPSKQQDISCRSTIPKGK